jgi:hypothetical protein
MSILVVVASFFSFIPKTGVRETCYVRALDTCHLRIFVAVVVNLARMAEVVGTPPEILQLSEMEGVQKLSIPGLTC